MKHIPARRRAAALAACGAAISGSTLLLFTATHEHTAQAVNWVALAVGLVTGLTFVLAIGLVVKARRAPQCAND